MNSLSKIVPISRGIIYSQNSIRSLSTQVLRSTNVHYLRSRYGSNPVANSRRFASHSTINLLQQQEQIANNELNNPQAQLEFYKSLLAYNYPHILVQRFETPGIASSPECVQLYIDALNKVGQTAKAAEVARQQQQQQYQYQTNGGNIGVGLPYGFGSRQEPVHVVVSESLLTILSKWLKWLIPIALLTYGATNAFNYLVENGTIFRNSETSDKSVDVSQSTVRFKDVQGCDEARAELEEIVDFLKDPSKFTGLGGKLPKGVLLTGPPGTGKTLLARATAGEAGVPFFFMSGSEFDELYVGVGAKRIRELFSQARDKAPAIIFIDELDAIGGKRNPKDQAYAKQTLNQLLVELDGFSQTEGIIIIGATNFPESLDKALTRPGRFDKEVIVDLPDVRGRIDILKHHMQNVETADDVDPSIIARGTPGLSGAELMNLVNQAAVHASQLSAPAVDMNHFEWAKDKILMGAAKKKMVITEESRINTAYHEAGHAIMAMFSKGATPLYKATILPRGRALGITFQLPEMDKVDMSKQECFARLDVCMGGKIAEEMINGKENVTSGCASDLSNATSVARAMVTSYGMSDKIGPVRLSDDWESWSPQIRNMADNEVRDYLLESEKRTRKLLYDKRLELKRLAEGLLEYETLTKEEMEKVVKGEPINKAKTMSNTVIKKSSKSSEIKDILNDPMPTA
ncbi:subunit of the mitochondrial inner membrane i-AAA protease complex, putative [Candida dubliniensis CD36]|uniref:Subunit of the mitochondrial inner membrane i-AAA protease complex, putative n=1 Tax=Candida dubliniensis (strain CD36 / ATCC MYA-646 / CBS 7987 / NCPF 3949 / NRRL Y-17841) TaxID=573826 RepID=B9WGL9_CANDC|nr:subunit of the mitochondrial inner membrane i-AAA protease complex, putative [Candida dubliniensis CD36]CAX42394.1 subunit of the mitochondrial inner membrane i-AAA protease complex, putative [Candida dubliniensis CD36]